MAVLDIYPHTHTLTHSHPHPHTPQDSVLLASRQTELQKSDRECEALRERTEQAEQAVLKSRTHYQAVTAGLSSSSDGQDNTLAAQKIGE